MASTTYRQSQSVERMHDALKADGPHPDLREEMKDFEWLVGVWDMSIRLWDEAGETLFDGRGQWLFDYILDGRGFQDVLITPNKSGSTEPGLRGIGTTVRWYDRARSTWRVVWNGVGSSTLVRLVGGPVGDEIHLEGGDDYGELVRWTFSDIQPDRFHWIGMTSSDGGATWWKEQEMDGVRQA
jgi:hypothetical protein